MALGALPRSHDVEDGGGLLALAQALHGRVLELLVTRVLQRARVGAELGGHWARGGRRHLAVGVHRGGEQSGVLHGDLHGAVGVGH